jgi:hypothetical protein
MWQNLIDVAREGSVHPREVLLAINEGRIEEIKFRSGGIQVQPEDVASLDLPNIEWWTMLAWAEDRELSHGQVREMVADRVLDGIDQGPRRRWVLAH